MRTLDARRVIKNVAAATLRGTGLTALRRRHRHGAVILTYHGVVASGRPQHEYLSRNCVDQNVFAEQMAHLARHYTCLTLRELVTILRERRRIPDRSVAVTFDDGFRNNYTYAFPVLRDAGVPATIFVTTGHLGAGCRMLWTERVGWLLNHASRSLREWPVGRDRVELDLSSPLQRQLATRAALRHLKRSAVVDRAAAIDWLEERTPASNGPGPDPDRYAFMNWSEAREMVMSGAIEIGSHTVSHLLLATGTQAQRREEIALSRSIIEREIERRCTLFAYPNGTADDFDSTDITALEDEGYEAAVTQVPGVNTHDTNLYALRRLNIGRGHDFPVFSALVGGLWPTGQRGA